MSWQTNEDVADAVLYHVQWLADDMNLTREHAARLILCRLVEQFKISFSDIREIDG